MPALNLPNLLTASRLLLSPQIPYAFLAEYNPLWFVWNVDYRVGALTLAILLALTDLMDGTLAKWLKQETVLGRQLDSLADFLYCCSLCTATLIIYVGYPILYWATIVYALYFVVYGIRAIRLRRKNKIGGPNRNAKWGMCALMTSMLCVLAGTCMQPPFAWHITAFILAAISASLTWDALEEYRKSAHCQNCAYSNEIS